MRTIQVPTTWNRMISWLRSSPTYLRPWEKKGGRKWANARRRYFCTLHLRCRFQESGGGVRTGRGRKSEWEEKLRVVRSFSERAKRWKRWSCEPHCVRNEWYERNDESSEKCIVDEIAFTRVPFRSTIRSLAQTSLFGDQEIASQYQEGSWSLES